MEMTSQPWKGGLNLDDDLENMPANDYQLAENLMIKRGATAFEKLYGSSSERTINGTCFGWFRFVEFSALFIDNEGVHEIYLVRENKTAERVFSHEFDLDTSIYLTDCVLINNEILAFSNRVNDPMKVHIDMGRLTVGVTQGSISFAGYNLGTVGSTDGFIHIDYPSGFTAGTTCLYLFAIVDPTLLDHPRLYSLLSNNVVQGELKTSNRFVTTVYAQASTLDFDGKTIGFDYCDTSVDVGYRKISPRDYYLINTPPLDPPVVNFVSDPARKINKLQNNRFQFQSKYVYYDNTESSLSPLSELLVDDGIRFIDYNKNNGILIEVKHPAIYDRNNIKEIVFLVRINNGSLYEIDRKSTITGDDVFLTTNTSNPISTTFYNDQVLLPVSDKEASSQFDSIGEKVGSIEVIGESVLTLSDNKLPIAKVVPNVELTYDAFDAEVPASDDWVFAYRNTYTTYAEGSDVQSGNNTYLSGGTQNVGEGLSQQPKFWLTLNRDAKGVVVDPISEGSALAIATAAKTVTNANCVTERNEEFETNKAFTYFDFGPTQEEGTIYSVKISLHRKLPNNGQLQLVKEARKDFICTTTTTKDLLDNIKSWVENNSGLNNFSYGASGDYVETRANIGVDGFENEFAGLLPRSNDSLQILSGYQCVHSDSGHYHWFQIDRLEVSITKTSSTRYVKKTFKNQAEHPIGLRYRDMFGRVLADIKVGSINLLGESTTNKFYTGIFKISHKAPIGAVKCDILYAGNKNFTDVVYAIIDAPPAPVGVGVNQETISLLFASYNEEYNTSLSYSFTKGDVIQRLASKSGGVYTEIEDKPSYKVLSSNGTDVLVEYDPDNQFDEGDLIAIHTPKLDVDDENTLYYESGLTLDVESGNHLSYSGQLTSGTINATTRLQQGSDVLFQNTTPKSNSIILKIPVAVSGVTSLNVGDELEILNTYYKGVYAIYFTDNDGTDVSITILTPELISEVPDLSALPFEEDHMYLKWGGSVLTEYTGVYQKSAYVKLQDFGDIYLRWRDGIYDHLIESYSISDVFDSRDWGRGRPVIVGDNRDINSGSMVYYSEPYYNNTNLNGISTVYGSNFEEYKNGSGDIKKTLNFDDKLLLFFERKVGWALVNKSQTSTANGDVIQSLSGSIISPTENYLPYDGGIGDQVYSVVRSEKFVYFADRYNANICRISNTNVDIISNVKMSSYFSELFKDNSLQIYSTFDVDTSMLILHLKSDTINRQLIWSEERDRWVGFWDIQAERILYFGELLSFDSNRLYSHSDTVNRLTVYGSQVMAKIVKSFATESQDQMMWTNMMIDPLFADDDVDKVLITNEEGQASELVSSDFVRDGSAYHAEFLRDTNSPNMGSLNALLEGDELQSKIITLEVKSDSTSNTKLNRLGVKGISAENK